MAIRIGDIAPDFTASTTEGTISFHDWVGDGWAILFSHPKDFTPVCTTELGYMAGLQGEFAQRNCKIMGLSVDPVEDHQRWKADIAETQGHAVDYPMIGDDDLAVAKLYDMIHPNALGGKGRTAMDNMTVRSVFVVGPDKRVKLILTYPMTTGRNFDEVLRVARLHAVDGVPPGGHPGQLEGRGRRDHRPGGLRRSGPGEVSGRLAGAEALPAPGRPAEQVRERRPAHQGGSLLPGRSSRGRALHRCAR